MKTMQCDVTDLLQEWANWSCSDLGLNSLETPTYDNTFWISDEEGIWIDSAVAKLRQADLRKKQLDTDLRRNLKRYSPRYIAIDLYYRKRYNYKMLANRLKCDERKAAMILKSAESFIECELGLEVVA